jgi:hypothetical protein
MTRYVLRAIDFGASVVFMAFCAKALFTHFHKDLGMQLQERKLTVVKDAPSLTAGRAIGRQATIASTGPISVTSSAAALLS